MNKPTGPPKDKCDDCGVSIRNEDGSRDGWKLEDGREVCQPCCLKDLKDFDRDPNYVITKITH